MNEQISHLEQDTKGTIKSVPFVDTPARSPREPDSTIKINAVQYAGILSLIGQQNRKIEEMKQDIRWAIAFGFLGFAIALISLVNCVLK